MTAVTAEIEIFDIVGATTFDGCKQSLKPRGVFLQNIIGLKDIVRQVDVTFLERIPGTNAGSRIASMTSSSTSR